MSTHPISGTIAAAVLSLVAVLALTGCGGSDDSSDSSGSTVEVEGLDALDFDQDEYRASAGEVTFEYFSDGVLTHNLLVEGREDDLELEVLGDTDTGSIDLDPGRYTIYCDIAGHREAGMEATLIVS